MLGFQKKIISFFLSFFLDGDLRKKYVFFWKVFVTNLSLIIFDNFIVRNPPPQNTDSGVTQGHGGWLGGLQTKNPREPKINFGDCSSGGVLFLRVLDLRSTQRIPPGGLRVEFLLKTDSGYPRDAGVFFHSRWQTPGSSLRFNTHFSAPPVSALACSRLRVNFLIKLGGVPRTGGSRIHKLSTRAFALLHRKWLKRSHEVLNFLTSRNLKSRSHLFKFLYITQFSYKHMFHNHGASAIKVGPLLFMVLFRKSCSNLVNQYFSLYFSL